MSRFYFRRPPMWSCDRCRGEYLTTQPIHTCASCDLPICSTCYDAQEDRCHPCADALYLTEDDVLEMVQRRPRLVVSTLAAEAYFLAVDEARRPLMSWYLGRVKDLLADLVKSGHVKCAWDGCASHRERRESAEILPLCEWDLADKGREYLRHPVSA